MVRKNKRMTVSKFRREFGITPLYVLDRNLLNKYHDRELAAYMVTMQSNGKAFSYAFIYEAHNNKLRAFVNGRHVEVSVAFALITGAYFKKKTPSHDIINKIFLEYT